MRTYIEVVGHLRGSVMLLVMCRHDGDENVPLWGLICSELVR